MLSRLRITGLFLFFAGIFLSGQSFGEVTKSQIGSVTTYRFSIDDVQFEKSILNGRTFQRATLLGVKDYEGIEYEVGAPEIPVIRFFADGAVKVRVSESIRSGTLEAGQRLRPNQPSHEKAPHKDPAFTFNTAAYESRSLDSFEAWTIEDAGSINGVPRKLVTLRPFAYNGSNGSWSLTRGFSVTVAKPSTARDSVRREIFAMIVGAKFKNAPAVLDYAALKARLGYEVEMIDVVAGDTAETIRTKLKSIYARTDVKLSHALIVGDYEDVPSKAASNISGVTDHYYRAIDTADYASDINGPDIGVGRITAADVAQMSKVFTKLTRYTEGRFGAQRWLDSVAFLATDDRWEVAEGTHNYAIQTYTAPRSYTGVFPNANQAGGDQLYAITHHVSNAKVVETMGLGRTIINYSGHGSTTSWAGPTVTQANVRSLRDPDAMPFVISNACITGDFRIAESFGETWIRHEFGAIAFWGSMDSSYWDEDDILERRMYDSIFRDGRLTFSDHTNAALSEVWRYYGGANRSKYYWETYVLFGDPSLDLRTETLRNVSIDGPGVLPVGITTASYDITDGRGPVAGARVALASSDHSILTVATTNAEGRVTFDLGEAGQTTRNLKISVSGQNTALTESNLSIIPADEPYLSLSEWTVNGRTDGKVHPDEQVNFGFKLANLGNKPTRGGQLLIESLDGPGSVVARSFNVPALPAGSETIVASSGMTVQVAGDAHSEAGIRLRLKWTTSEGQSATTATSFRVVRAQIAVAAIDFGSQDVGQGGIRPGETGDVFLTVKNTGSETIDNGSLTPVAGACVSAATGSTSINGLSPGAVMRLALPLSVTIDSACHAGDVAQFEVAGGYASVAGNLSLQSVASFTAGVLVVATESLDGLALAIPDKTSVTQSIPFDTQGSVREVGLYLKLDHTYVGDLKITLIHPDGTQAVVWNRAGGSADLIDQTFGLGGADLPAFAAFAGKPAQGEWKVEISDEATGDTGTLSNVHLTVRGYLE